MSKSLQQQDFVSFTFSNNSVLNVAKKAIISYIAGYREVISKGKL